MCLRTVSGTVITHFINYPYFWASSKASICCLFVWFFVWSQTELLQFPSDDHLHFSCCRSPRVFKRSLSKQRNLCGSDQSLYMYLCRRVYWTPLPKWWVVSMLINCWHVKGSVEWSRHERHFCSLLPYHCDFKLALTKKSRPCRGTFARANQADRCMNWLHCAQRSTPWLLDKHGFDRNVECFSWFERFLTLPVGTWLIAPYQYSPSQCGRLLRVSQSH